MDKIELKRIFLERIKREASYQWILTDDLINEITKAYAGEKKLCKYDIKTFDNPFSMALDFYNKYYPSYYKIIIAGLETQKIFVGKEYKNSFVSNESLECFIKLNDNDYDFFLIVHELAHFIDCNSNPRIIPTKYNVFAETFSMYMEKKSEEYLASFDSEDLIKVRRNNRFYFENNFLQYIDKIRNYVKMYNENIFIKDDDIDYDIAKLMKKNKDIPRLASYLFGYIIGNLLSEYFIFYDYDFSDKSFIDSCLDTSLKDCLKMVKKYSLFNS